MLSQAYDAIKETIREEFEDLTVSLNWPGPNTKINYPYLSILTVSQKLDRWPPELLEKYVKDGVQTQTVVAGQWQTRIDFHLFSKDLKDQIKWIDAITSYFDNQVDGKEQVSTNKVIRFGEGGKYSLNLQYLAHDLDQSQKIQSGDRRTIFELIADIPHLVTNTVPIVKEIDLDAEVSESIKIAP